ncbi:MAG: hypothetical protein E7664_04005 [Ruminococcaceae bacterium]|nr:hypothetical protein [Oscillospiraceae bacterium]
MKKPTKAWKQYEAGLAYKQQIGLYETVRRNERFYRGDQWYGQSGAELPKPVFNLIRRVVDYLIGSVSGSDVTIRYTDDNLPFMQHKEERERLRHALDVMGKNAAYRWEQNGMDHKVMQLLTDAAVSGDGVLYCYWDPELSGPDGFVGDIVTEVVDSVNLFVADVNRADIQSQDYVMLSGRATVGALRREALAAGLSPKDAMSILPDKVENTQAGDHAAWELEGDEEAKATYLIRFWREKGSVVFEKSVRDVVIRHAKTDCTRYPIAYFNWYPTKNSFHGTSPVSAMIPNQKYINRAYAMAMKHMTDTAFSKVVYDKSRIPEWSNEVGEAIAAVGGGNMADAVSVVGVGEMQSGYMELIENAIMATKEMMGATESALGNMEAQNTSAIIALQETSRVSIGPVRAAYYRCIEDLANVWADMMCAYYPNERLLPFTEHAVPTSESVSLASLQRGMIRARVDVCELARYTSVSAQNVLDLLWERGAIDASEYVRRLPAGLVYDREGLIEAIQRKETENEHGERGHDETGSTNRGTADATAPADRAGADG